MQACQDHTSNYVLIPLESHEGGVASCTGFVSDFICILIEAIPWIFLPSQNFSIIVPRVPSGKTKKRFCLQFLSVISVSIEFVALITNILFLSRFNRVIRRFSKTFPVGMVQDFLLGNNVFLTPMSFWSIRVTSS
jgi:hypothetical protein